MRMPPKPDRTGNRFSEKMGEKMGQTAAVQIVKRE
jgi:hypothetical protein